MIAGFLPGGTPESRLMSSTEWLVEHMAEVPALVIPCYESTYPRQDGDESFYLATLYGSIFPAVWNFQLALHTRGYGTCITTLHLHREQEVRDLLGIPDSYVQGCLLPVGRLRKGFEFKPARRRAVDEVVVVLEDLVLQRFDPLEARAREVAVFDGNEHAVREGVDDLHRVDEAARVERVDEAGGVRHEAPPVADALARALGEVRAESSSEILFGYEPAGGSQAHRRAGALWLAERGIEAADDQLLITQGANDGLLTALATVTRPGDCVLCEAVNYAGLRRIAHLLGLSLMGVAIDGKGMVPAALADAIRQYQPRAVICTPVTHNPTGATMDAERRRQLAQIVRREQVVLIEDDINGHLGATEPETMFALAQEKTIYVTSMSKCLSAGLRVGFMTAAPAMMPRLRDALYSTNWTAPSLHAAIASRLIVSGMARQCVAEQRQEAGARMDIVRRCFGDHAVGEGPSYHTWITLDRSIRPEEWCVQLLKAGVMVSPAHHFAVPGSAIPNAIRIGLGGIESRLALEEALQIVVAYLAPQTMPLGAIA
jgi:DNA-binding transcriptional MocR family regulator